MLQQLIATAAQSGHLEYSVASRHAPPQQVGGRTGLSRLKNRTNARQCRCQRASAPLRAYFGAFCWLAQICQLFIPTDLGSPV